MAQLAAADAPSPPPAVGAGKLGRVRIVLQFARDTWVEIRDREGQVLISGTGHAASERQLEGVPPFAVTIGNVGGVRITYNGKPLDVSAYAAHNIARFTLE
jgi:cytoskeleton protein RodZ